MPGQGSAIELENTVPAKTLPRGRRRSARNSRPSTPTVSFPLTSQGLVVGKPVVAPRARRDNPSPPPTAVCWPVSRNGPVRPLRSCS